MIYRVYAQCVNRLPGKAIEAITADDLYKEIDNATFEYFNNNDISFLLDEDGEISDQVYNKAFNAIADLYKELFNENKLICLGDYCITESDERPQRGNMGSDEHFSKEDILKKMKEYN